MNSPTTNLEEELANRLLHSGIDTDVNRRWESGVPHHPESERLAREIGAIDWMFQNDSLGLKFGGDGDNGEFLMYAMDIIFDLRDAEQ